MMGVDDLVTDLVARRLEIDLEVLDEVLLNQYVANDSLLRPRRMVRRYSFRFADSGPRG